MIKIGDKNLTIKLGNSDVEIYLGSTKVYPDTSPSYDDKYLTFEFNENGYFRFNKPSSSSTLSNTFYYSKDNGENWTSFTYNDEINVSNGDEVLIKCNNPAIGIYGFVRVVSTALFNVYGNIMSLLYGDNFAGQTSLIYEEQFDSIFLDNSKLINANNLVLPSTTLTDYCYTGMFAHCTNLITTPSLPATTLAEGCYQGMFDGCSSLTNAPVLPATTLASQCYTNMFINCTSLTNAPVLPATTLVSYCYNGMFGNCTSLTNAPELPATTLANGCYYAMFQGCSSLVNAPELPATIMTDWCYNFMFRDCTSLTTAPLLPATTLVNGCYSGMFQRCSSLNNIKALFITEPDVTYTRDWVSGVAANGTFEKNIAATWSVTGNNGIPTGWNVIDYMDYVVCVYNPTSTSSAIKLLDTTSDIRYQIIDGVQQQSVQTTYTFDTLGEHTVKYKLNGNNIEYYTFYDCTALTSVIIPSGVTTIQYGLFDSCTALTNITIPDSVTTIGSNAFNRCSSLTSITIPSSVTSIGTYAFSGCRGLTSVTLPSGVTSIGGNTFENCTGLTSITIPSGVTSIGSYAFENCSGLTSVTISNSVTIIGQKAFYHCTSLTSITIKATTPPTLGSNALTGTNANLVIYVPAESVNAYKTATNWSVYADYIQPISE